MLLRIQQNSQENTCVRVPFWITLQAYFQEHLFYKTLPVPASSEIRDADWIEDTSKFKDIKGRLDSYRNKK